MGGINSAGIFNSTTSMYRFEFRVCQINYLNRAIGCKLPSSGNTIEILVLP